LNIVSHGICVGIVLAQFGCIAAGAAGDPLPPGHYGVALVGSDSFPARLAPRQGCDRILTGGTLGLDAGGEFTLRLAVHSDCGDASGVEVSSYEGAYTQAGRSITFAPSGNAKPFAATAQGADIVLGVLGTSLTFVHGQSGQADVSEFYFREYSARMERELLELRELHGAYNCHDDPILDRSPAVPVTDTTGLGARIERHFPGWRLSTEREIACRFSLLDGSRPENYWGEQWGSGRAWWVWSGDFNGDGRQDRLVLLSSRSNPSEDLLVALFANGQASEVASPGGWGVTVGPGKGEVVEGFDADEPPVLLRGDAVTLIYWEKAAEVLYWRDGQFHALAIAD